MLALLKGHMRTNTGTNTQQGRRTRPASLAASAASPSVLRLQPGLQSDGPQPDGPQPDGLQTGGPREQACSATDGGCGGAVAAAAVTPSATVGGATAAEDAWWSRKRGDADGGGASPREAWWQEPAATARAARAAEAWPPLSSEELAMAAPSSATAPPAQEKASPAAILLRRLEEGLEEGLEERGVQGAQGVQEGQGALFWPQASLPRSALPQSGASPAPPPRALSSSPTVSPLPRISAHQRFNSRLMAEANQMDQAAPPPLPPSTPMLPPPAREAWGSSPAAAESAASDEDEQAYIAELHRLRAQQKAAEAQRTGRAAATA